MKKILLLGGARSGKSNHATQLATGSGNGNGKAVCLIVTAQILDSEMANRIEQHRRSRPADWQVVEAPFDLPAAIRSHAAPDVCLIVDCLTLWLANCLEESAGTGALQKRCDDLVETVGECTGMLILVSNEVGWGIVPDNPLARRFRDEAGRLHQRLATVCDEVKLVVAGLPLIMKTCP